MRVPCSREMSAPGCACAVGLLALTLSEYFRSTHFQLQWAPRLGARYALPAPCVRVASFRTAASEPAGVCRRAYSGVLPPWSARSERAPVGVQCVERSLVAGFFVPSCDRLYLWLSGASERGSGPTQLAAPLLSYAT